MDNRFYTADEKLSEVTHELLNQGFEELDLCLDNDQELSSHILIDAKKKTFYHTDEECLKNANILTKQKFNQSYKKITLKQLKKMENLNFLNSNQALKKALKQQPVKRSWWEKDEFLTFIKPGNITLNLEGDFNMSGFYAKFSESQLSPYQLTNDDLLSEDWQLAD